MKLVEIVADILRKGVAEGKVRSDIEPEALAEFLLGMVRTRELRLQNVSESMRRFEMVTDLFCNGAALDCRRPIAESRMADKMTSSIPPPRRQSAIGLVRSFGHRNYRLFFMGQGVSLIGTWMQNLALGWLVYSSPGRSCSWEWSASAARS